jgi:hypothetical protein
MKDQIGIQSEELAHDLANERMISAIHPEM